MEILALFGWGAKVDYVNDPRLDEISYTQLKRWMLKQDGAIKRGIATATNKFALLAYADAYRMNLRQPKEGPPPV